MSPEDHAHELAAEYCGNWREFQSFGWSDKPEGAADYAIIYTTQRDAPLTQESNTAVFTKLLEVEVEAERVSSDDIYYEEHSHWAVGWVGGFVVRVRRDGELTPAWLFFCEAYLLPLSEYPLLSDEDHSEREFDGWLSSIEQGGSNRVEDAPENWVMRVYEWLQEHEGRVFEYCDSEGPYVSKEAVERALEALGWLDLDL